MDNSAPFYLDIKWFKAQPMGVNKLNSLTKDCAQLAGIGKDKRITNHSAQKTLVQELQGDYDIPSTQIVQISRHKILVINTTLL